MEEIEIKKPITVICNNSDSNIENQMKEEFWGNDAVILFDIQGWSVHKFSKWLDDHNGIAFSVESFKKSGIDNIVFFTMQEPMIDLLQIKIMQGKIKSEDIEFVFISSTGEETHFTIDKNGQYSTITGAMHQELLLSSSITIKKLMPDRDWH